MEAEQSGVIREKGEFRRMLRTKAAASGVNKTLYRIMRIAA